MIRDALATRPLREVLLVGHLKQMLSGSVGRQGATRVYIRNPDLFRRMRHLFQLRLGDLSSF